MKAQLSSVEALKLWQSILLKQVRDDSPDLTIRQAAILFIVYMEQPPHTVRGLAARLNVTKPVITRALDTLGKHGFLKRKRDENDKRNVLISRTVEGALYLEHLADHICEGVDEI